MGMSVAKPQGAASIRPATDFSDLLWYPSEAHTEPGAAQLLLSSSRVCNREGKSFPIVCAHTENEMTGEVILSCSLPTLTQAPCLPPCLSSLSALPRVNWISHLLN